MSSDICHGAPYEPHRGFGCPPENLLSFSRRAVAQNPYLLPFTLTVSQGAGAAATLKWVLIWTVIAVALVVPALALLYTLDQRTTYLGEDPLTSESES